MSVTDIVALFALLVAMASYFHSHGESRQARLLLFEQKRIALRVRAKKGIRHFHRAERKTEIAASVLEEDSGFRSYVEEATKDKDTSSVFRAYAERLAQKAKLLEGMLTRLDALEKKADRHGVRLGVPFVLIQFERMLGGIEEELVDAEAEAEDADERWQRQKEFYDEYRQVEQRVQITSPVQVQIASAVQNSSA